MTAGELARVIGKSGSLVVEVGSGVTWQVPCRVVDARLSWGEVQYRVAENLTANGEDQGAVWVKASRVVDLVTAWG